MKIQEIAGLQEAHPLELLSRMSRTGQKAKNPYLAMLMYKVNNDKPMSRQEQADLRDYLKQAGIKIEGKGDFPWQDDVTKHQQKQMAQDYDKDIKRLGQQALAKAKAAASKRPKVGEVAEGDIDPNRHPQTLDYHEGSIDHEANAMASAVTGRIMRAHPDLLSKYGPEAVMQAIDDVTEGDDWEEIGTSDVSAYVKQVISHLRDRHGVEEGLRQGEWHDVHVTFDDGTTANVKTTGDSGFRDQITQHFARQGKTVKDIEIDWSVKSESETNERELTKHELERREEIVKGMKKAKGDFEKRYGDRAQAVMYATATKMAKNEDINESARMSAEDGHYYCEAERKIKPIPEGYVKVAKGYIMKKA